MKKDKCCSLGSVLGAFMASVHALWSLMVIIGLAQGFLDWIYSLHFLNNPYKVTAFNLGKALILLVVTYLCGYLMGWFLQKLWEKKQK